MHNKKTQKITMGNVSIVTLGAGVTDMTMSSLLLQAIDGATPNVLVDLEELELFDSARLGELLMFKELAKKSGGDLKLLKPRGKIRETLEAVNLTAIFEVFDRFEPALRSFTVQSDVSMPTMKLRQIREPMMTPVSG